MKLRNIDENKKTGRILLETGIFFIVIALLCVFGIWQSISQNWTICLGGTNFPQGFIKSDGNYYIAYLNQESIYISFLSVLFSFLGNKEEVVSILNLILQVSGIVFFYLGTKKLFHHVFSLIIAVICTLLSCYFYPVISDTSMHIIWFLSGFMFWLGVQSIQSVWGNYIPRILAGILLGIFCYIDFAGFFLLITFISLILMTDELNLKEKKIPFIYFLYFLLGSINGYFVMFYLWNDFHFDSIVFQKWFQDKISFLNPADLRHQYLSIAIILGIVIIYYLISSKKKNTTDSIDNVLQQIASSEEAESILKELETNSAKTNDVSNKSENVMNNKGIMEEIIIETPTSPKPVKLLENPLPLPKKHVKKEMNYAFEPTPDQMYYDLNNYRLDDDYDLKDI